MKSSLRIKSSGNKWNLTGNTVVKGMDDTEMLFRIVTMTEDECMEFANSLSKKALHNIVLKIREHRIHAEAEGNNSVTSHVVKMHTKRMGWN